MTIGGIPNSNIGSNNDPHDKISHRQPVSTLKTNDIQGQSLLTQRDSHNADTNDQIRIVHWTLTMQTQMTKSELCT